MTLRLDQEIAVRIRPHAPTRWNKERRVALFDNRWSGKAREWHKCFARIDRHFAAVVLSRPERYASPCHGLWVERREIAFGLVHACSLQAAYRAQPDIDHLDRFIRHAETIEALVQGMKGGGSGGE